MEAVDVGFFVSLNRRFQGSNVKKKNIKAEKKKKKMNLRNLKLMNNFEGQVTNYQRDLDGWMR